MISTLGVAVIGQWLRTMFSVRWLVLLCCFGVDRGLILSCVVIAVFAEAGFGAASASSLWLLLEGVILRCILPFLIIVFLWCIHHVYIM